MTDKEPRESPPAVVKTTGCPTKRPCAAVNDSAYCDAVGLFRESVNGVVLYVENMLVMLVERGAPQVDDEPHKEKADVPAEFIVMVNTVGLVMEATVHGPPDANAHAAAEQATPDKDTSSLALRPCAVCDVTVNVVVEDPVVTTSETMSATTAPQLADEHAA